MQRWQVVTGIILVVGVLGFLFRPEPVPDLRPVTDKQVNDWMANFEQKDGIEFLEQGGSYADRNRPGGSFDRELVLPLLQRIQQETGQKSVALLMKENPKFAGAIAVSIPDDEATRKRLQTIFFETDEQFAGLILRQYGDDWMHFEIMDEEFAKASKLENWNVEQ